MRVVSWLLVLLVMSGVVRAAAPESESGLAMPQTLEQARLQRGQAESMRAEAERRYAAEQNLCYGKFLVNHCLAAARTRYTETMVEARRLAQSARDFEREARREELEAKETQRLADQQQREAEQSERGERYRAEEAAKAAERERKGADKTRKAAEGRQKTAAEQARRQAKLEKRAREEAEREAKRTSSTPDDKPAAATSE